MTDAAVLAILSALMADPQAATPPAAEAVVTPAPIAAPAPVAVPVTFNDVPSTRLRGEVLAKDMADLATMIGGRWDSDSQAFFEPELGVPESQRRPRVHALVRPLPATMFGKPAFFVEHRAGSEHGTVLRQRVWTLSVDTARDGIQMDVLAPISGVDLTEVWTRPGALEALTREGFSEVGGCDVLWRKRGGGFSGETRAGGCRVSSSTGSGSVTLTERHDLGANIWEVRDIGVDERGQRVFGSEDGRATRFDRATSYVCWAGQLGDGQPAVATGLTIHDRGGEIRVADPANGGFRVRLRTVEWPFGNNRPSLTLYLLATPGEQAEAYVWSDPGANRLAISLRTMQASCTRSNDPLWN